jgi:hypothetical protein
MLLVLLAKIGSHHFFILDHVFRLAVGDLLAGDQHDKALRKGHDRAHDVLDHDDGDAALVHADQQRHDILDLGMRQAGHRFVGDQKLRLRRHGAGKLELAHLDLGEVGRVFRGFAVERDKLQQLHAAVVELGMRQVRAGAGVDRIEQRHADILGDRHAAEWTRQLETARQALPRALMRDHAVDLLAVEGDTAGLVLQRAADAVDQCALAGAVRADQAEALAARHRQVDAVEGDETAEAFAELIDVQQRSGHGVIHDLTLLRIQSCTRPTMPRGAMITKKISSKPTISKLTAEEIVTVATCCSVPSSRAPTSGPIQDVVPPIMGMAIELTA